MSAPQNVVIGAGETLPHLRVPNVIGWETTLKCNMRCRHCGSTAGAARCTELSPKQAQKLCLEMVAYGVPRVCLTGGETLMRPDWPDIVETLLGGGIEVGMLTNGWLFTERMVKALSKYAKSMFYLSVSLDGTDEVHDKIRDLPGSFDRAWNGAKALRAEGIPVGVITTMNRANLPTMEELRRRMFEDLQPYCWQLQTVHAFGRARDNQVDCGIDPVSYMRAATFTVETRRLAHKHTRIKVYTGDCLGYLSSLESGLREVPWPGCGAGLSLMSIQSNGNVKGCLSIIDDSIIEGNVVKEGLRGVWEKRGAFAYNRAFRPEQLRGACASCPVGERCRAGCTAAAFSRFGRPHEAPFCMRTIEQSCGLSSEEPTTRRAGGSRRAKPKPKKRGPHAQSHPNP